MFEFVYIAYRGIVLRERYLVVVFEFVHIASRGIAIRERYIVVVFEFAGVCIRALSAVVPTVDRGNSYSAFVRQVAGSGGGTLL